MKEKILAQLKLACGEKTSVSDRTLDKLATTLSLGVTDEAAIPALIEAQKPFLQMRMVIGWSSFAIPTTHKIWESKSIIIMR